MKAGQSLHQLTSCRDWLPTFIDWCGLKEPQGTEFDGASLTPLVLGRQTTWKERTLFVQRQGDKPTLELATAANSRHPHYAVLTEKWRFVDRELFDITNDPGQTKNVAVKHSKVVDDLRLQYKRHFADVFSDNAAFTRFQLGADEENPTLLTVRDWHPTKGRVIWRQEQLGNDALQVNGLWAVNVVQAGRYSIRLAMFPDDAPGPIHATKAILQIGEQRLERNLDGSEVSVEFDVNLPKSHRLVQSWFRDKETGERGAYFVHVERLDEYR